jgi:nitrogen fixation NifU-like protein
MAQPEGKCKVARLLPSFGFFRCHSSPRLPHFELSWYLYGHMSDLDDFVKELQEEIIRQAREQYSGTVVEHWLRPRNPFPMESPDGHAGIKGPCGDTMEIFIRVREGRIAEASFLTDGCITSIAAGSMAVQMAVGKSLSEAAAVSDADILDGLGGLPDESLHCALLAANTLHAAVEDYSGTHVGGDMLTSQVAPPGQGQKSQ